MFKNVMGLANAADVTADYATSDALDTMSIVRISTGSAAGQYTSDPNLTLGVMGEELDNGSADGRDLVAGTLDFVAEMALPANGRLSDTEPNVVTQLTTVGSVGLITTLTPQLTWSAGNDPDSGDFITSYLVELSTNNDFFGPGATYRINLSTTSTSWTVPANLTEGKNYFWSVRARDREGLVSKYANVRNFRIDVTAPSAVTDLTGTTGTGAGEANLSWTAPGNDGTAGQASSYRVKYATWTSPNTTGWWDGAYSSTAPVYEYSSAWEPVASRQTETRALTGLTAATSFYFAVRAKDAIANLAVMPPSLTGPVYSKAAPSSGGLTYSATP
ncbi:MAG: fibronectin type III domain-containing protein, partial [bacterium]